MSIKQVNGRPANDYKQSLILSGIGSPGAICSCVCCMEEKSNFHLPSERFQKYRDPKIKSLLPDAHKRVGENSVINTSKRYQQLTGGGKFNFPDDMACQINIDNSSSFEKYLIDISPIKTMEVISI